jgi:cytoskeletal protein CcmA (bactofilin family)
MWKPDHSDSPDTDSSPQHSRNLPPAPDPESESRSSHAKSDQATISKGLFFKGEVSGGDSLFIDGKMEGSIILPGSRVTVGRNGQVGANISVREFVVMGKVRGNVTALDRVDIRAEGALSGDVTTARISIEDGAYFKGGIDIRIPETKPARSSGVAPEASKPEPPEPEVFRPEVFMPEMSMPEVFNPEVFMPEVFNPEMMLAEVLKTQTPKPQAPKAESPEPETP